MESRTGRPRESLSRRRRLKNQHIPNLRREKPWDSSGHQGNLAVRLDPCSVCRISFLPSCLYNMAINLRYPLYHITLLPCRFTPISSRYSCRYPSMDYTHDVPVPSPLQPCCAPANIDRFWSCSTACASYWTFGPSTTYTLSAALMFALSINMRKLAASL